jgi:hypothetical protein
VPIHSWNIEAKYMLHPSEWGSLEERWTCWNKYCLPYSSQYPRLFTTKNGSISLCFGSGQFCMLVVAVLLIYRFNNKNLRTSYIEAVLATLFVYFF